MVLKQVEIRIRKDAILAMVVEHYIQTVLPISSAYIAKESYLDLSSATIRNVLAELEEEGFLTHPHTSAGRMPTQKGYRYYVDHLMKQIKLLEEEKNRIKTEYERESKELEQLLEKTSEVLSNTTQYTSIISVDGWGKKIYCRGTSFIVNYPEQNDIEKIKGILVALDEKEELLQVINRHLVNKVNVLIGHEIACKEMDHCALVISSYQTKDISGRIAILGPTRMDYSRVVSTLDYVSRLMQEII